jgi:acyl carrier protein
MQMSPGLPPFAPLTASSERPPDDGGGQRLYKTLAAVLGIDEQSLSEESSPDTIQSWDSLNHLNIILAMEQEFGIELSVDDAMNMVNIGRIREMLRAYGVEA